MFRFETICNKGIKAELNVFSLERSVKEYKTWKEYINGMEKSRLLKQI